ncbi:MAG TPA: hypothetical protein ENH31_00375 [Nitrospirae bacterium]|nr:hypothetical protein [Nitrospirota bacterium]HDK81007.1 hypothetical protein [Nitrospirota bacterium]
MPEPKALHVDSILSNLSIKYFNAAMIWALIMPLVKVNKRSDKFTKYNKADSFKLVDDKIGPKSLPNEVDWGVSNDNYSVNDHALGDWLPQETIDNADNPIQPELDTNDFINLLLDIAQEKRVADLVFAAGTYPAGNKVQLSGTGQWSGSADDPIGDLLTAVESCFVRANTLVFGADVWKIFRKLPEVLDAVKGATRYQGSPGGLASTSEVASLLEVENVLVGRSRYITTKEGQTPTYARLWGKHCAAMFVEKSPGIRSITFALTIAEMLRQTQRDFDPKRGIKGAHYIKVACNTDEKVIANDLGYFIEDAVA